MTAIDRTAYPQLNAQITPNELEEFFTPTSDDITFSRHTISAEDPSLQLSLLVLLKSFQKMGYLPQMTAIPTQVTEYIAQQLNIPVPESLSLHRMTRSRFRRAIQAYLKVKPYHRGGAAVVEAIVEQTAEVMSDPADLINVAIEQLILHHYELPVFSTIDRLVNHIRHRVHQKLYREVATTLTAVDKQILDQLLQKDDTETRYPFTRLKGLPAKATLTEIRRWENHLRWMEEVLNPQPFLERLSSTKIEQFASQAYQLEVSDMVDIVSNNKRYTLLLCLLYQMQVRTRDQLVEMFLKRIQRLHNNGKEQLRQLQEKHRGITESMVDAFAEIVTQAELNTAELAEENDLLLGRQVRQILNVHGGTGKLKTACEMLQAYHDNNYLPLLPRSYRRYRTVPFRLTDMLCLQAALPNPELFAALEFIHTHWHKKKTVVPADISLDFASARWQSLIRERVNGELVYNKMHLEICIFSYIAEGLRSGDIYVDGSEAFADYRTQLLPWDECQEILESYCQAVELPSSSDEFVDHLREELTALAKRVDAAQTADSNLYFDSNGKPHLRRLVKQPAPPNAAELKAIMKERLPERHLLDVLSNTHYWTPYTRHFGPPSGSDPKLPNAIERYLLTIFGYGCNLGAAQTARHVRDLASTRIIGKINSQHITREKLDAAIADLVNEYSRFHLPYFWGTGRSAVADGTQYELHENNLLGERHIRYGGYGGIAYHHISDTYIALFSHFIACGVWEAVYILDGLLKNRSVLQPDKVHADTHGQSEVVFGLAYLLGIELLPRMRNWNKVSMYRPHKDANYKNIDAWFSRIINWELIKAHWRDLMQVIISIHKGKVLPSWLLQKLNSNNPKNKLYKAFQELGRAIRTRFLLIYVSDTPVRLTIQKATIKIERYNDFLDWVSFGGEGLFDSRDPVEYQKRLKYQNLVANAIMLQNVVDMTNVLYEMIQEGYDVTSEVIATFSPYLREHIKRFGEYVINIDDTPPPLNPDKVIIPVSSNGN